MRRNFKYAPEFPELKIKRRPERNIPQQQVNSFSSVSSSDITSTLSQGTIHITDTESYKIPVNL